MSAISAIQKSKKRFIYLLYIKGAYTIKSAAKLQIIYDIYKYFAQLNI